MICDKCGAEVEYFIEIDALYSGRPELSIEYECPECGQCQDRQLE